MRNIHTICRRWFNIIFRIFWFGYIAGRNFISLTATISSGLTLRLGRGATIGRYAQLSCREHGSITIGANSDIDRFVILETQKNGHITIGTNTGINAYSVIYGAGGVTIGDNTRIACHTVIVASSHIFDDPTKEIHTQGMSAKGITIGNDVWIGAGVRIVDGVTIGDHAVIGAGAVVTKDIPPNAVAVGVPARVLRLRGEV